MKYSLPWLSLTIYLLLTDDGTPVRPGERGKRTRAACSNYFYEDIHKKCTLCELCGARDILAGSSSPNIVDHGCTGPSSSPQWCKAETGTKPICTKLKDVPNGSIECRQEREDLILPGTVCTLTCDPGYRPVQNNLTTQCSIQSSQRSVEAAWSRTLPECVLIPVTEAVSTTEKAPMASTTTAMVQSDEIGFNTKTSQPLRLSDFWFIIPISVLLLVVIVLPAVVIMKKYDCLKNCPLKKSELTEVIVIHDCDPDVICHGNSGNQSDTGSCSKEARKVDNKAGSSGSESESESNDSGLSSDLSHQDQRTPMEHDEIGTIPASPPEQDDWTEDDEDLFNFLDNLGSLSNSRTSVDVKYPVEEGFCPGGGRYQARNPIEHSFYSSQVSAGAVSSFPSRQPLRKEGHGVLESLDPLSNLPSRQPPSGNSHPSAEFPIDEDDETTLLKKAHNSDGTTKNKIALETLTQPVELLSLLEKEYGDEDAEDGINKTVDEGDDEDS
ncbi:uncharacterized protein LOC106150764 isoform X1 [Lingula anatina]|uniref:Uncharacterized protein LOC106150764 isoform X1 n=1 Tax=Lingula anatina TaxID=7574 RepID=A0A1S3GZ94_LINAN|nr:uncharacterized protein LOC106150764 isoform X1 [Lingula anatina]|eukprot:XP_013379200.1 uncharacterized protein LOC106150764 isoform X1 [Lingula anatina]